MLQYEVPLPSLRQKRLNHNRITAELQLRWQTMSSLGYGPAYVQTRGGRDWILRVPKHARPGAYTALTRPPWANSVLMSKTQALTRCS